jgi:dihydropteroate synthase
MDRCSYIFCPRDKRLELGRRTRIMGVVNITPDSFSDGGRFLSPDCAVEHCFALIEAGADLLDLGGESSRPGAEPTPAEVELERLLPVVEALRKAAPVIISVDTYKAAVAREALKQGADVINDINACRFDAEMFKVVKAYDAGMVLMHMRGTPQTMQSLPPSPDILTEVENDLDRALLWAYGHGISRDRILLDPGIGFGKTFEDNLAILNRLPFLRRFAHPIVVGASRKSFLGRILDAPPDRRLLGTVASSVAAILHGAHVLRVHDVKEVREAAQVADAILAEGVVSSAPGELPRE